MLQHILPCPPWQNILAGIIPLLLIPPVVAYLALNFTGCTPFTSRTGVRTEIFRYIKMMVSLTGFGIIVAILYEVLWFRGVG